MKSSEFLVTRFENRNGTASWRVDGRLNGVRIRRNFKTKEEACAEKATLEIRAAQIESGRPNEIATSLTIEQVRDAETAFRRLEGAGHSLMFCADFTLTNYRKPERQRLLTEAVADYLAAKERERDQRAITACQVVYIGRELRSLLKAFPGCVISDLTAQRLRPYCERNTPSLKTVNNRRGILSTFFKFAFQHDWVASNPIEKVPSFRLGRRRSSPPETGQVLPEQRVDAPEGFAATGFTGDQPTPAEILHGPREPTEPHDDGRTPALTEGRVKLPQREKSAGKHERRRCAQPGQRQRSDGRRDGQHQVRRHKARPHDTPNLASSDAPDWDARRIFWDVRRILSPDSRRIDITLSRPPRDDISPVKVVLLRRLHLDWRERRRLLGQVEFCRSTSGTFGQTHDFRFRNCDRCDVRRSFSHAASTHR